MSLKSIRHIEADEVDRLLDYPGLIDALDAGHRDGIDEAGRTLFEQPDAQGNASHFLIWPAWRRGEDLGIKVVTVFPGNRERGAGLASVHALYLLFDGRTGQPRALIDGTAMTPWKTAADSALGARYLAPERPATLLMVGAGVMAPHLIRAHLTVRPSIERIRIWNRSAAGAEALSAQLADLRRDVAATGDLEGAVRQADVISCATMTNEPLIEGAWLKPGTHLDLVGGFTPEMREADDAAAARADVYVDSRWFTVADCGDIAGPIASGAISREDIRGDLFDLASGKTSGRRDADAITLFKNAGGAHLDLMTAAFLLERGARPNSRP